MSDVVLCEQVGPIATLMLNRPEKLNALNYALIDRLLELLDAIEIDQSVRAIILTGAGDRAFSTGGDIYEFSQSVARGPDAALSEFLCRGQRLTSRLEFYRKPIIAAVNGIAFGGGCEITEAAALAIASDQAIFSKPEIKLGMPPTFGGTQRLPRLAGRKRALELLLTGDPFTARRACDLGLINRVVPQVELMRASNELAEHILRYSSLAVTSILTAVNRGIDQSIAGGLSVEAEAFARLVPTADLREGLNAWMSRRAPTYTSVWTSDHD